MKRKVATIVLERSAELVLERSAEEDRRAEFQAWLTEEPKLSLMIDSGIFDKLAAEPAAFLRQLGSALKAGRFRLSITHQQQADELARIPDEQRRQELRAVLPVAREDGQLLNVAWFKECTLVTNDDRMTQRAWLLDMKVWDYARFRAHVGGLK